MKYLNVLFNQMTAGLNGAPVLLNPVYKTLIVVLLSLATWFVVKSICSVFQKKANRENQPEMKDQSIRLIRTTALYVIILVSSTYISRLFKAFYVERILYALFIVVLAVPAKDFIILVIGYLKKNIAGKTASKVDDIIFDLANRFAGIITIATALILSMDILGVNVMPFIAGAGVAGIAIGFAAKDTLSNLIAGVLLIIDRPFEIGDRIEAWNAPPGSSTWGDVIDIGIRATKIKTTDNIVIIIPNNEIMKRDIINYTIINTKIRVRINIGVSYDTDIKRAKDVIIEVAKTLPWISKQDEPVVVVRDFGESSINLQLRVWIEDARQRIHTISFITDRIKEAFDRQHIEIPFPKRDVNLIWNQKDKRS